MSQGDPDGLASAASPRETDSAIESAAIAAATQQNAQTFENQDILGELLAEIDAEAPSESPASVPAAAAEPPPPVLAQPNENPAQTCRFGVLVKQDRGTNMDVDLEANRVLDTLVINSSCQLGAG